MFAYTYGNIWASSTNANANPRVKMMELFVCDVIFFLFFFLWWQSNEMTNALRAGSAITA